MQSPASFVRIIAACVLFAFAGEAGTNLLSLAELRAQLDAQGRVVESFAVEAVVCDVARDGRLLALQDSTACVLLETPELGAKFNAGDVVRVTGENCALTRGRDGIQLGTAPVVNNDGHHGPLAKSGVVYLTAGLQPFHLTWFNGRGPLALGLEIAGPGLSRQPIPNDLLVHKNGSAEKFVPGLNYAAYAGTNWGEAMPDFQTASPAARGVAENIDVSHRVRDEGAGLVFDGFISIPAPGLYTFYLVSDDGAYLSVGNPAESGKVVLVGHESVPAAKALRGMAAEGGNHQWARVEGKVTFASQDKNRIDLVVTDERGLVQAEVVDAAGMWAEKLLGRRVLLTGIYDGLAGTDGGGRLFVPGRNEVEIKSAPGAVVSGVLTTAKELRDLSPGEARRRQAVRIRGVVIWSSPTAVVVQDETGGVYTRFTALDWTEQPQVGERWELEGVSDPGDFSPVLFASRGSFLGSAALPEPIRPTWSQILNGSLDAEYVELRGALTRISPRELTLLTAEGKIRIRFEDDHPLPQLPVLPNGESCLDSIIRIRGCFTAYWDQQSKQVWAGEIGLCPGIVEVDEAAPRDPFSIATKRVTDLALFDPSLPAIRRAKVKGQIVLSMNGEAFLQDGKAGLRLRPREPVLLHAGDVVEAVGFVQMGGPSPILQEALVRMDGSSNLVAATPLGSGNLRGASRDSTRISVEGTLVDDYVAGRARVLEMQSGQNLFFARLPLAAVDWPPLEAGSVLLLTGVYLAENGDHPGANADAFELWLNGASDIQVLQRPSWWTLRRALAIAGTLCGALALALMWIALLRGRVKERTAQLQREIEERQLVEQRRIMEQERARVAQDLHDELGAGLTEVGLLGDLAKNPIVPALEKTQYLEQLTDIARSLVTSLDAIVWAINPRYDTAASLASYYTLFAQRFLNLAGVACRPEIPADFPECPLEPKERHELFLAFKEALNNIVRHAGATEVRLKIAMAGEELVITISDNGCGIQPHSSSPDTDGLENMRRRMEQLGGVCTIVSRAGLGATVTLRLPVGHPQYD